MGTLVSMLFQELDGGVDVPVHPHLIEEQQHMEICCFDVGRLRASAASTVLLILIIVEREGFL